MAIKREGPRLGHQAASVTSLLYVGAARSGTVAITSDKLFGSTLGGSVYPLSTASVLVIWLCVRGASWLLLEQAGVRIPGERDPHAIHSMAMYSRN